MNKFEISKHSLTSLVRLTIENDSDVCLHQRSWLKILHNQPLRIRYVSRGRISVQADIETRFGQDMVKVTDKAAETIRKNLENHSHIKVHSIRLNIKDVFNEATGN